MCCKNNAITYIATVVARGKGEYGKDALRADQFSNLEDVICCIGCTSYCKNRGNSG